MWNRVFLIALIVAILPMAFLTYYSWDWLSSIGSPAGVVENFAFYSSMAWGFLWISTVVLLILANVVLWQSRRSLALWSTLVYFAAFVAIKYFWLERSFSTYLTANGINEKGIASGILFAVILCVAAVVLVFFNEMIAVRLNKRIYPPIEPQQEKEAEPPA
jgi:hypothetical protein